MHNSLSFEVNGRRIAAMEWGQPDGVPLLALHGWLDNAASFTRLARMLPGVRLIALDLCGHGLSDHRPAGMPYYIWDNVPEVLAVADQLGLRRFDLLGHSMGAAVSTLLAGAFPGRVRRLFLIDGLMPLDYEAGQLPELMAEALQKRARAGRRVLRPYGSFEQAVQARMGGRWPVCREAAQWLLERGMREQDGNWHWRSDSALTLPSVVRLCDAQIDAFLGRIGCPVDLVMAEQGLGLDRVQQKLPLIDDIELHIYPGGHHLHLEADGAARIAKLISDRLQIEPDQGIG
ncbi:hydrolase [Marinobacterium nitratireducens]|uniref:Hydrolase n=1 Tax=Marinobacterium nitratireducens TaxID=518897 RepID=A0A917Z8A5_9GAMM|nr:alpha/beta fold hydrolase [Marinobacterium nitratireducens]GGO75895.1 hydrolase [Marinobacterium nitratireducens]